MNKNVSSYLKHGEKSHRESIEISGRCLHLEVPPLKKKSATLIKLSAGWIKVRFHLLSAEQLHAQQRKNQNEQEQQKQQRNYRAHTVQQRNDQVA